MDNLIFWVIQEKWATIQNNAPKYVHKAFIKWSDAEEEANRIRLKDNKITLIVRPVQISRDARA